jgi:uncharacterized membrane protein YkvI
MQGVTSEIKGALGNGDGNALIYTAVLSAMIANVMPTPADAIYFWRQSVDKEKLEKGEITPTQYWTRDVVGYYSYTALWYGLVLTIVASMGGTYQNKARILLGLLGAGVVVGVVANNIKKDEKIKNIQNGK